MLKILKKICVCILSVAVAWSVGEVSAGKMVAIPSEVKAIAVEWRAHFEKNLVIYARTLVREILTYLREVEALAVAKEIHFIYDEEQNREFEAGQESLLSILTTKIDYISEAYGKYIYIYISRFISHSDAHSIAANATQYTKTQTLVQAKQALNTLLFGIYNGLSPDVALREASQGFSEQSVLEEVECLF